MGAALFFLAALVLVAIAAWFVLSGGALTKSAQEGRDDHRADGDVPGTLRYVVPRGQDPAVVMAALTEHGYASQLEEVAGQGVIAVECGGATAEDRDRVRAAIASAPTAIDTGVPAGDRVRFEDETGR